MGRYLEFRVGLGLWDGLCKALKRNGLLGARAGVRWDGSGCPGVLWGAVLGCPQLGYKFLILLSVSGLETLW